MKDPRRRPSIEELWIAPELASLTMLEAALDMALLSMLAVYPEMQDLDRADQTDPLGAAIVVIEDARTLAASLARYRLILRRVSDRADNMPF
jgi:hypothetical protein